MTGFGRGTATSGTRKVTIDLKSLNSKQLDLTARVPAVYRECELEARALVASMLTRGKVEMTASYESLGCEGCMKINEAVVKAYKEQIEKMSRELGVTPPADWMPMLLRLPDSMHNEQESSGEEDANAFLEAVRLAAASLMEYRCAEGRKLYDFFIEKIANIGNLLEEITPMEQERVPKIKCKLEEQLSRLTSIEYDAGRLEQELIFYIEKLDVTEEKTRLRTHLNYFLETMGTPEEAAPQQGQGKKLGFIAQEMGREINTLGSKSNHAGMQKIVVRMKDELEQIKEQVLNVL